MSEYKLYMVYHLGGSACCNIRVATCPEEAMTQCLDHSGKPKPATGDKSNCKVEEVKIDGFKISVEKI